MADFKYEIVEHIGTLSEVPKDGQRNSTEFHGMAENQVWYQRLGTGAREDGKGCYVVWGWDVEAKGVVVNIISNGYLKVFDEMKNLIWQLYDIDA